MVATPSAAATETKSSFDKPELIDWQQLACLLCKRKFSSSVQLRKHQQMSDLHKVSEKERVCVWCIVVSFSIAKSRKVKANRRHYWCSYSEFVWSECGFFFFLKLYSQLQYRDRAKERRDKFGTDAIVPGWKKRFERERAKEIAESTS